MAYLKTIITDTMGFWDDFLGDYVANPNRSKTFTDWYRLPEDWLHDGVLIPERRQALLRHMYGPSWRLGNGDGSKYVVLNMEEHLLSEAEVAERPWLLLHDKCYTVDSDGVIADIDPSVM
jgi:hypothetical protein